MVFMAKKKIFAMAKGFRGRRKNCITIATRAVMKKMQYQYVSRKLKKRDMRRLWIARVNAGARNYGVQYSRLINGLGKENIKLNRKMLSNLALYEPLSFRSVVLAVKESQKLPEVKPIFREPEYGHLASVVVEAPRISYRRLINWDNKLDSERKPRVEAGGESALSRHLASQRLESFSISNPPPGAAPHIIPGVTHFVHSGGDALVDVFAESDSDEGFEGDEVVENNTAGGADSAHQATTVSPAQ
jgi:large subunit ribosomal protein L20